MYENQFQHEGQVGRRGRRGNVRANSTVTRVLAAQRWLSPKDWPVLGFFFQGLTSVFFFSLRPHLMPLPSPPVGGSRKAARHQRLNLTTTTSDLGAAFT